MKEWIRDGPCEGIKHYGGNPAGVTCDHPNNDPIIERAAELKAIVYVHTWMIVGNQPRRPGGGNQAGESTPMELARLAERFPEVPLVCGHSGGDWELGVRAVRPHANVLVEFSGSDPHSGQVDETVAQLGAERLVWGGHGPTRSYSTELSKVLDADLNDAQRKRIFGGNPRRIAEPIFRRHGDPLGSDSEAWPLPSQDGHPYGDQREKPRSRTLGANQHEMDATNNRGAGLWSARVERPATRIGGRGAHRGRVPPLASAASTE